MYRFRKFEEKDHILTGSFVEFLDDQSYDRSDGISYLQGSPICNVVTEGQDVYGFIAASREDDTESTLFIRSLRLPQDLNERFSEVFEFLIRATVIQGRMEGYERVVIIPRNEDREIFTEWGFTFTGDESEGEMEYLLSGCRGYCPFCRAC